MSDIVPFSSPLTPAGRQMKRLERQSEVVERQEEGRKAAAMRRLAGGAELTAHYIMRAAQIEQMIGTIGADKPFLEAQLRDTEMMFGMASRMLITNHMIGE